MKSSKHHSRKKHKVKKKSKTKTNRLGKGKRQCDYEVGNCLYTSNVRYGYQGRYKAHMTQCPTHDEDYCTHVTIMDTWYPEYGHWHFGKKRNRSCYCTRYVEPHGYDFEDEDQWYEVFNIFNDITRGQQNYQDWNNWNY